MDFSEGLRLEYWYQMQRKYFPCARYTHPIEGRREWCHDLRYYYKLYNSGCLLIVNPHDPDDSPVENANNHALEPRDPNARAKAVFIQNGRHPYCGRSGTISEETRPLTPIKRTNREERSKWKSQPKTA